MEITAEETGRFREGVYKMMCGVYEHDPRRASDAADRVLAILALSSDKSSSQPTLAEKSVLAALDRAKKSGKKDLVLDSIEEFRGATFSARKAAREALERAGCEVEVVARPSPGDLSWVATWKD